MANTVRIAGAQIPIHNTDIRYNLNEIKKALDWAAENNVDIIQTPEASLSGYDPDHWMYRERSPNFDDIELPDAILELEKYQRNVGVGLNLGTCLMQRESSGLLARNIIRHYDKQGMVYGVTEKTHVVGLDGPCISAEDPGAKVELPPSLVQSDTEQRIHWVGMICNDMWSYSLDVGRTGNIMLKEHLLSYIAKRSPDLIFHATHGYKFPEKLVNEAGAHIASVRDNVYEHWHTGWLAMTALSSLAHILTVDSCTEWSWDGNEDTVDQFRTGSISGVINPLGEWVVQAPRYGRQYFYYDYDLDSKLEYFKTLYSHKNGSFKTLLVPPHYHGEDAVFADFFNQTHPEW